MLDKTEICSRLGTEEKNDKLIKLHQIEYENKLVYSVKAKTLSAESV